MLAGAAGSVDLQADAEGVRPNLLRVKQAAEQRVLRTGNRMERAGAIEAVGKRRRSNRRRAAWVELDLQRVRRFARARNPPGNDLEAALGNHAGYCCGHFRRNAVTMDVPPRPRMTK